MERVQAMRAFEGWAGLDIVLAFHADHAKAVSSLLVSKPKAAGATAENLLSKPQSNYEVNIRRPLYKMYEATFPLRFGWILRMGNKYHEFPLSDDRAFSYCVLRDVSHLAVHPLPISIPDPPKLPADTMDGVIGLLRRCSELKWNPDPAAKARLTLAPTDSLYRVLLILPAYIGLAPDAPADKEKAQVEARKAVIALTAKKIAPYMVLADPRNFAAKAVLETKAGLLALPEVVERDDDDPLDLSGALLIIALAAIRARIQESREARRNARKP